MVALASDKKSRLCERCFASVPVTEAFCHECGAAMQRGGADGSDAAVYPELARANLLRMRGDYKQAEEQCLSILRRYPNNGTANVLLGDICAEKGDLEQAMQWYEMALDLAPDSAPARAKLERVRTRFREKETMATVEQLGLPTTKSKAGIYAIALIASIFIIAVVAYFLGQRVEQKRTSGELTVPVSPSAGPQPGQGESGPPTPNGQPVPARDDDAMLDLLRQRAGDGDSVVGIMQDPRTGSVVITFAVGEGEQARVIGARLARDCFKEIADAQVVTVRGTRRGQLVFVADVLRSRNEETLAPTFQAEHAKQPDAWVDHILTREWPPRQTTPDTIVDATPEDEAVGPNEPKPVGEGDEAAEKPAEPETTTGGGIQGSEGSQPESQPPGGPPDGE